MSEHRINPRTRTYLESLGVVPEMIPEYAWDATGYETFLLDGTGRRIYESDSPVREWHEWPNGFDYETFLTHWESDRPTRWWR